MSSFRAVDIKNEEIKEIKCDYTAKCKKIDQSRIKYIISCDNIEKIEQKIEPCKEIYCNLLNDSYKSRYNDKLFLDQYYEISIGIIEFFFQNLQDVNSDEKKKEANKEQISEIIQKLKEGKPSSELSFAISIHKYDAKTIYGYRPCRNIQISSSDNSDESQSILMLEDNDCDQILSIKPSDTTDKIMDMVRQLKEKIIYGIREKNQLQEELTILRKQKTPETPLRQERNLEVLKRQNDIQTSSEESSMLALENVETKTITQGIDESKKTKSETTTQETDINKQKSYEPSSIGILNETEDKNIKQQDENQELEKDKQRLQIERNDIKRFRNRIIEAHANLIRNSITEIENADIKNKEEVQELQNQLSKLNSESENVEYELSIVDLHLRKLLKNCLKQLKEDKDIYELDNSELGQAKSELENKIKEQSDMLESFRSIYGDEEDNIENISDRLNKLKEQITKSINNVNKETLYKILEKISDNVDNSYAIKRWSHLERLEKIIKVLDSKIQEPGFERFSIAMIKGLEKGINENQIDWEVTAQFLIVEVNDYVNNNGVSKDIDPLLDSFLESLGFSQINTGDGSSFNSREHDVDKVMATQGYARGQIVNTVKRGLKRGDRVIQKALVNIAQ